MSTSWDLKHFSLIEDTLLSGETVYLVFEGLHNYQSTTKHDKNFAYAITSKRIILAQKKVIGSVLQTISLQKACYGNHYHRYHKRDLSCCLGL